MLKSICVFCGSSSGRNGLYVGAARELGKVLAEQKIRLVYGGAKVGLMGAVADAVLKHGGEVIGVLPYFLSGKEIAHPDLTQLIIVDTMHERKTKMSDLADGFIALPGGMGTMEELCEILTWAQLGLHQKPAGILNAHRFYNSLITLFDVMVKEGLLKEKHRRMLLVNDNPVDLLKSMQNYEAPLVEKWIDRSET